MNCVLYLRHSWMVYSMKMVQVILMLKKLLCRTRDINVIIHNY